MDRRTNILLACLLFMAGMVYGQDSDRGGLTGTAFTKGLMRATNAGHARDLLGISTNNPVFDTDQFDTSGAIKLKDGITMNVSTMNVSNITGNGSGLSNVVPRTLYVQTNGSDVTGNPFKTLNAAVTASVPGDTIIIGAGNFTNAVALGSDGLVLNNLTVRGAGMNRTFLCDTNLKYIVVSNNVELADLCILGIAGTNYLTLPLTARGTNVHFKNVVSKAFDGALGSSSGDLVDVVADNCHFWANQESFTCGNSHSNSSWIFNNCRLTADGGLWGAQGTYNHCISSFDGKVTLNNCELIARGTNAEEVFCIGPAFTSSALLTANNCKLLAQGSVVADAGGVYSISQFDWVEQTWYTSNRIVLTGNYDEAITNAQGRFIYNGVSIWGGPPHRTLWSGGNAVGSPTEGTNIFQMEGMVSVYSGAMYFMVTNPTVTTNALIILTKRGGDPTDVQAIPHAGYWAVQFASEIVDPTDVSFKIIQP